MKALDKILNFFWPDQRSGWEKKRERLFIDAANRLENFYVTGQGGISMDPEEARDAIQRFASQHDSTPQTEHPVPMGLTGLIMERYAWRRLDHVSVVRYEFLISDKGLSTVVAAERFPSTITCQFGLHGSRAALGNTVKAVTSNDLIWRTCLESAIKAYEEESEGAL